MGALSCSSPKKILNTLSHLPPTTMPSVLSMSLCQITEHLLRAFFKGQIIKSWYKKCHFLQTVKYSWKFLSPSKLDFQRLITIRFMMYNNGYPHQHRREQRLAHGKPKDRSIQIESHEPLLRSALTLRRSQCRHI